MLLTLAVIATLASSLYQIRETRAIRSTLTELITDHVLPMRADVVALRASVGLRSATERKGNGLGSVIKVAAAQH